MVEGEFSCPPLACPCLSSARSTACVWCIQGKYSCVYVCRGSRVAELSLNACVFVLLSFFYMLLSFQQQRASRQTHHGRQRPAVLVVRPPTVEARHKPLVFSLLYHLGDRWLCRRIHSHKFAPILRDSRLSCFSWLHERNIGNAQCQLPERQLESILSFLECVIDVASGGDLNSVVDDDVRAVSSACVESMQQCLLEPQCHDSARRIFDGVERDR